MTTARGLTGLRQAVDATVLADLRVTPAMQERLRSRIRILQQLGAAELSGPARADRDDHRPAPALRRRWRLGAWVTAAAAIIGLALNMAPRPDVSTTPMNRRSQLALDPGIGGAVRSFLSQSMIAYDKSPDSAKVPLSAASAAMPGVAAAEVQPGRKIIINGDFALRVPDARATMAELRTVTTAAGGYVAEATLRKEESGAWRGELLLRVPAAQVGPTVEHLSRLGKVEMERQWSQDVTDQFMDLEHRLVIQREHEQRLRELAARADSFDDWNKLTTQLNETRTRIENMAGQLKLLANQVDFAILNVHLLQPAPTELHTLNTAAASLPAQLGQTFVQSLQRLAGQLRQLTLGLASLLPYLLAILLPLVVWRVRRRRPSA